MSDPNHGKITVDPVTRVWDSILHNPIHKFSMVAVIALAVAMPVFYYTALSTMPLKSEPVLPPSSQDPTRAVLVIDANRNDYSATFKHAEHQKRLGGDNSCATCHHLDKPGNLFTGCFQCHRDMDQPTAIFDHSYHINKNGGNAGCKKCHTDESQPKWSTTAAPCSDCHEINMRMAKQAPGTFFNFYAPSYEQAMHGMCVECHRKMDLSAETKQAMEECSFCHGAQKKTRLNQQIEYHLYKNQEGAQAPHQEAHE